MIRVIRGVEAPHFELPGVRFTALAAPSRGSAEVCTWQIEVAPGLVSEAAHTLDHDEVFMVVAGELRLVPDGAALGPGDVAVVPAGEAIQLVNRAQQPARAYVVIRAGFTAKAEDGTAIGTPPWAQ